MAQQRADAAQGVADAYARSNKEQKQAREELARAQKDSERRSRQASDEATRVVDARERALDAPAQGERKIALAEAEARHTTAVQRCNEMRDNAVQNRCAIDADAALEQARREAAPPSPAN
jgi:hypothetical protein